uniref:Protein regulator of cytokinesis 1 n=2 Tax=Schistocephalus solidus TaxID=70667 RepID=A0A0V0J7K0_SCHSO
MTSNEFWRNELIEEVKNVLLEMQSFWEKIGYDCDALSARKDEIRRMTFLFLNERLENEHQLLDNLSSSVDGLREEVRTLEKDLEISSYNINQDKPLLEQQSELSNRKTVLIEKVSELTADFRALQSTEKDLCEFLGLEVLRGFQTLPTASEKAVLQARVDELLGMKNQREGDFLRISSKIKSYVEYVGVDCFSDLSDTIAKFTVPLEACSHLTEIFIKEADDAEKMCFERYQNFRHREEELYNNISSLRSRLGLSPCKIPEGQSSTAVSRLQFGLAEYERLRALRLQNIQNIISKCQIELEELWRACFVSRDYCASFRSSTPPDCSEEMLCRLETEVSKWKAFKSTHADFFAALNVWVDTLNRIKEIEIKRQDPEILKNRGGILLKLDKEDRRLRQRDLPQQITLLQAITESACAGPDSALFAVVCVEGQPLADLHLALASMKENDSKMGTKVDKRHNVTMVNKLQSTSLKRNAAFRPQSPTHSRQQFTPTEFSTTKKSCILKR